MRFIWGVEGESQDPSYTNEGQGSPEDVQQPLPISLGRGFIEVVRLKLEQKSKGQGDEADDQRLLEDHAACVDV